MDQKKEEKEKLQNGKAKPLLSLTEIMENPLFQKVLEQELDQIKVLRENYDKLREQIQRDYQAKMNRLHLAKSTSLKELLEKYPDPSDLAIAYLDLHHGNKPREHVKGLLHKEKETLEQFFQNVIRNAAILIINQKNSEAK